MTDPWAGYDVWKTTGPAEEEWRRCECGHSEEDHGEIWIVDGDDIVVTHPCELMRCQCRDFVAGESARPEA